MLANVAKVISREGLPGVWKRVVDRYRLYTAPINDDWDKRFNVQTAAIVPLSKLDVRSHAHAVYACHYQPIGAERFHRVLRELAIDHSQFTFIDIGSGKGKALMLAAEYPWKECIGVEFSAELNAIAERNFANYTGVKRCPIRTVVMDATQFQFPDSPLVVYLYNPFEVEVLAPVIANLKRSRATPLYVLYYYPPARFAEFPQERGAFDAAFTPVIQAEGCSIYRG